jgi:hypothetical protein
MATGTMPPRGVRGDGSPRPRGVPAGRPPGLTPRDPKAAQGLRPAGLSRPARPVSAPRHTRPVTGPDPRAPRPVTGPATASKPRLRSPRAPFILLLIGLLGGALVSLLVISTTLAQGSFQITSLQQQNASLARQEQALTNAVAKAADPAVIAGEAEQLGMRQNPNLRFINLKNGKIVTGKVSKSDAEINIPGYTP